MLAEGPKRSNARDPSNGHDLGDNLSAVVAAFVNVGLTWRAQTPELLRNCGRWRSTMVPTAILKHASDDSVGLRGRSSFGRVQGGRRGVREYSPSLNGRLSFNTYHPPSAVLAPDHLSFTLHLLNLAPMTAIILPRKVYKVSRRLPAFPPGSNCHTNEQVLAPAIKGCVGVAREVDIEWFLNVSNSISAFQACHEWYC